MAIQGDRFNKGLQHHPTTRSAEAIMEEILNTNFNTDQILAAIASQIENEDALNNLDSPARVSKQLQNALAAAALDCDDDTNVYATFQSLIMQKEERERNQPAVTTATTTRGAYVPHFRFKTSKLNAIDRGEEDTSNHSILNILDVNRAKTDLGLGKIIVAVQRVEDGNVSELTHSKHCAIDDDDDDDDDISLLDINAFHKMKNDDRKAWEQKWGNLEFARISQQIMQAVLSLDLQIGVGEAQKVASKAISIAIGWSNRNSSGHNSVNVMKKIFGDLSANCDFAFKERYQRSTIVHCTLRNHTWGDNSFGICMILHSSSVIDVYRNNRKLNDNTSEEGDESDLTCIFTIEYGTSQKFPLGAIDDESFSDCCDVGSFMVHNAPDSILVDHELGMTSISFFEPLSKGPFVSSYAYSRSNTLTASNGGNKKVRTSIRDAIDEIEYWSKSENDKKSSIDNEIFLIGDDMSISDSPKEDNTACLNEPTSISFRPVSAREIIKSVECSSCHVLALTNMGSVYSCGDGSHGQLGHGLLEYCKHFRMITAFVNSNGERTIVTQISAGSDDTSSHSAAIDSENNLFTWGKSLLCGHLTGAEKCTVPKKLKPLEGYKTMRVSCGGGFTLVIVEKDQIDVTDINSRNASFKSQREVLSWGRVSNGRLGTGKPKKEYEENSFRKSKKQLKASKRYESSPTIISNLSDFDIIDISAGMDHALAVSRNGQVFAWGSNLLGQCSAADIESPCQIRSESQRHRDRYGGVEEEKMPTLWGDVWFPRYVHIHGSIIKSISAGGIHSAAIDKNGLVYTWGGGGSSGCLGHGDLSTFDVGSSTEKTNSLRRKVLSMSGCLTAPYWSVPRSLQSLREDRISQISCGRKHCVAVSINGNAYFWGGEALETQQKIAQKYRGNSTAKLEEIPIYEPTAVPTKANELIFQRLEGKCISHVACCNNTTFCIASDDALGKSLGSELLGSIRSRHEDEKESSSNNILADCALITGGHRLYCHKIIISQRSSVLKGMLILEGSPQDLSPMTELVISGMSVEVMKCILCFIYTDNIPDLNFLPFEKLLDVWHASARLNLPKLAHRCKLILKIDHGYEVEDHNEKHAKTSTENGGHIEAPLPTFAEDISGALEDNRFADVCLLVDEDKFLYAHECILRCASVYFRHLLDNAHRDNSLTTLRMPGSYNECVRLLFYLYTGFLPPTNENIYCEKDLVDDLINAERYQLKDLKSYCDSTIIVTVENATDMLLLGIKTNSYRLKIQAMNLIAKYLVKQVEDEARHSKFMSIIAQCPTDVKDELFELIKSSNGIGFLIPQDRKELAASMMQRSREEKSRLEEKMKHDLIGSDKDGLSIRNIIIMLAVLLAYSILHKILSFGPIVSAVVNSLVLVLTGIHMMHRIE